MARNNERRGEKGENKTLDDWVDDLFKLTLAEFTGARNELAARLKHAGRVNEANLVKTFAKPSISAWAVNQLYWNHRAVFDQLIAAGQRVQKLQRSGLAGKVADMRMSLDARRKALAQLSDLATSLLSNAGHSPTLDTIRRITTTLEALSSYQSFEDGPTLGRLTHDVDPPGFEALASWVPSGRTAKPEGPTRVTSAQRSDSVKTRQTEVQKNRQLEETRRARIADAKFSVQDAKKSLAEARATVVRLESAQKKTQSEAKEAEKERRDAEERLKRTTIVSKEAAQRARDIADEAKAAAKTLEDARRTLEKASKELETLFRESPTN